MLRAILACFSLCLVLPLAACSDDVYPTDASFDGPIDAAPTDAADGGPDGPGCSLRVATIGGTAIDEISNLTANFDQDDELAGIQVDIQIAAVGLADETTIELVVSGLASNLQATLDRNSVTFSGVSIDDAIGIVQMQPLAEDCPEGSEAISLNVQPRPACSFVTPAADQTLTVADDRITTGTGGIFDGIFNYEVIVQATEPRQGSVGLAINGAGQGSLPIDVTDRAVFPVVLSKGQNVLQATVEAGELQGNCELSVNVEVDGPACNITGFTPAAITVDGQGGLGPAQDSNATPADGLQTTLTVTTDDSAERVTLVQDNFTEVATLTPTNGTVDFPLNLTEERTYSFQATCVDDGTSNANLSPRRRAIVDLTRPDAIPDLSCEVTSNRTGILTCRWLAVADPGSADGTPSHYLVRYRVNDPINDANFDAEDTIAVMPNPAAATPGDDQEVRITGLSIPNTYYVAVKAIDALGNISAISNLPGGTTFELDVQEVRGTPGSKFGFPIVVGDFNCDNLTDMAVGLFDATVEGKEKAGEVQLFFGSPTGFPDSFSKKISGTSADGRFGITLAALQYDGDEQGCTDLAVLGNEHDGGRGRVYIYLGRQLWATDRTDVSAGLGAELVFTLAPSAGAEEEIGQAMAASDMDGDGRDDLAMSYWTRAQPAWSNVLVVYGETGIPLISGTATPLERLLPASAGIQVTGGSFADAFALRIARGGRLNGDRYGDLLVASRLLEVDGVRRGAIYVLLGAERGGSPPEVIDITTSTRALRITGAEAQGNSLFGMPLEGVGDVNNDGTAEFAVGDPLDNGGTVYLFNLAGAAPTTTANAVAVLTNDLGADTPFFGTWIANGDDIGGERGADIDRDGIADLLIGSLGASGSSGLPRIFFGAGGFTSRGASAAELTLIPSSGATSNHSTPSVFLGDVNGDEIPDMVIGDWTYNSNQGRILVYF